MTYLEAVSLMKEIESRYDLMQIKIQGCKRMAFVENQYCRRNIR